MGRYLIPVGGKCSVLWPRGEGAAAGGNALICCLWRGKLVGDNNKNALNARSLLSDMEICVIFNLPR